MQKNYRVSNRGRNEEEEDDDPFQKEKFLSYAVSNKTFSKLDVYLDEAIQESKYYRPLIEHMQNLSEGDQVIFILILMVETCMVLSLLSTLFQIRMLK